MIFRNICVPGHLMNSLGKFRPKLDKFTIVQFVPSLPLSLAYALALLILTFWLHGGKKLRIASPGTWLLVPIPLIPLSTFCLLYLYIETFQINFCKMGWPHLSSMFQDLGIWKNIKGVKGKDQPLWLSVGIQSRKEALSNAKNGP